MRQSIIRVLLALFAVAGQAKNVRIFKAPKAMASVNVYQGELKAREVILADTATTVHFTIEYPTGKSFQFARESYLMDEDGNRYALRSAVGIPLNQWITSPESGQTDFTMNFEPLPKETKMFDFFESDDSRAFMLLGIKDGKTKLKAPSLEKLSKDNLCTIPGSWFSTDTVTIKGRIEGYSAELFGFTSMECNYEDVFEPDGGTIVLDIAPDGTFLKRFQASYPLHETFYYSDSKVGFSEIPFFARPGETIDITVRKDESGQWKCVYNSGSSKNVERLLRSKLLLSELLSPLESFDGTFREARQKAEEVWQNLMYRVQMVGCRDHFTPFEMQLALADAQSLFAEAYMSYTMNLEGDELFYDYNYSPLHHIDFNNPLLFQNEMFRFTQNEIHYAEFVTHFKYKDLIDEKSGAIEATVANEQKALNNGLSALRDMMGADRDNLMSQLCVYRDILDNFDRWRYNEEEIPNILSDSTFSDDERRRGLNDLPTLSRMFPIHLEALKHPYLRQKAEHFYSRKKAQKDLATPLPADNPAADLIRSLCAKYPGKYLLIDFWSMGCGPCRSAIQKSKEQRAEIAGRDDVKLVFIAEERTAEGSEAYHKYVGEWLAGEETICLNKTDFCHMEELFRFNSIPHYETITPDCRRVREDRKLGGLHNIDNELQKLKKIR